MVQLFDSSVANSKSLWQSTMATQRLFPHVWNLVVVVPIRLDDLVQAALVRKEVIVDFHWVKLLPRCQNICNQLVDIRCRFLLPLQRLKHTKEAKIKDVGVWIVCCLLLQ